MSATDESIKLPTGKTCADCLHCKRCCMLYIGSNGGKNTKCDFAPSKFSERTKK